MVPDSATLRVIHATYFLKFVQGMNNAAALVAIRVCGVLSQSGGERG